MTRSAATFVRFLTQFITARLAIRVFRLFVLRLSSITRTEKNEKNCFRFSTTRKRPKTRQRRRFPFLLANNSRYLSPPVRTREHLTGIAFNILYRQVQLRFSIAIYDHSAKINDEYTKRTSEIDAVVN